ncbi:MAG: (2Fe-2S)-binding protein [Deltaproteobacteria bacterium]|nr:(2Fe-2S)-binding protein [Deltaproteobacteria bacterium]
MIKITVDNRDIEVLEGQILLDVCLENGIYIPNLCYIKDMKDPPSSCRLCFVEIEGHNAPVASCSVRVREGMVVKTDTAAVRRLQLTALGLLLSRHHVECAKCPANKKCELQRIAKFLKTGLKQKQFDKYLKEEEVDDSHPCLLYFPNRCVLCGRCIYVCEKKNSRPAMTFAGRGLDTIISFYGEKDNADLSCEDCLACVEVCPVAALSRKEQS